MLDQKTYDAITARLQKYGYQLFAQGDTLYHTQVFRPTKEQIDVDSVLAAELPACFIASDNLAIADEAYLNHLQRTVKSLYNGTTFAFRRLEVEPLRLWCDLGYFYDNLLSCAALDAELRANNGLALREQYYRTIAPVDALFHGRGRSAAVGVAVLTVFNNNGRYEAILGRRSQHAATYQQAYHVVPAFIFQPSTPTLRYPLEWSIRHQIYREFLEELFGLDELLNPDRPDYFYQHPALQGLQARLADGRATLQLTGISFNLRNLRPEVCAVLIIHDEAWCQQARLENGDDTFKMAAETEHFLRVPIETDEAIHRVLPAPHLQMPPQGATAFWLGVAAARQQLNS